MMFDTYSPRSRVGAMFDVKMKKLSDICLNCIGQNLHGINRVGRYLPTHHKELLLERLVNHDCLTDVYLPHVTYNLFYEKLKRVNLYKSDQITDNLMKQLSGSGCQLEWLTIHACPKVTDVGIQHITEYQTELQCLELRKLQSLTKKGLSKVFSKKLKKVDFRGCHNLENEGVITVADNNSNINHLILVRCNKITESVLGPIADKLNTSLEVLDIADMRSVSDVGVQAIAEKCTKMQKLNLGGCNLVTDTGMGHVFAKCQQMKSLNLSYCGHQLANNQVLKELPCTIIELSLCGVLMKDSTLLINSLTRLKNLRMLWLCGVPALNDETLDQILSVIGVQLYELDLSGGMVLLTDKGLKAVTKYCTSLRVLGISLLQVITGTSLLPLLKDQERAEQITGLMLSCRKLNFEVLQLISLHCHNLQRLDLGGVTTVDDILLNNIAQNCRKLNYINLKGCIQVSDDGICELAKNCPLGVIVLAGMRHITDKSIHTLANSCPYLEEIYMNGCYNVSREAIKYLVDYCIPRVYWTHKIPSAENGPANENI